MVYGVPPPPYDTIPLIHTPEWDFDWQGFYIFKYLQKLPAGYKLYGKVVYENTTKNSPQNVSFGENTTDEMFLIYFQYLPYQTGDEFVHTDSLLRLQNTQINSVPLAQNEGEIFLTTYPNPSRDWTTIDYYPKPVRPTLASTIYRAFEYAKSTRANRQRETPLPMGWHK